MAKKKKPEPRAPRSPTKEGGGVEWMHRSQVVLPLPSLPPPPQQTPRDVRTCPLPAAAHPPPLSRRGGVCARTATAAAG